jgi:hypothetical protein
MTTAEALAAAVEWLERSRDSKSPSLAQVHATVLLDRLAELEAERDDALKVPAVVFAVMPSVIGKFFDDAHEAWVDGAGHGWTDERFQEELREACHRIASEIEILDPVALKARAKAAEARVKELEAALQQLRQWDCLVGFIGPSGMHEERLSDAPYWRNVIDRALATADEAEGT